MSDPVAFNIKSSLGRVIWADERGSFAPGGAGEVTLDKSVSLELLVDVGVDQFALLLTLAMLAIPDEDGRLVVEGGVERVRQYLDWGKDKAQRVFNEIAAAGFATRETVRALGPDNRPVFSTTRLVLHENLYRPGGIADSDGLPLAATGKPGSDSSSGALTATGKPGSDDLADSLTAAGGSGDGAIAPDRATGGLSGSDESGSMYEDDDETSSSLSSATPLAAAGGREPSKRHLRALLKLGFTDARSVWKTYPYEVLEESLRYINDNQHRYEKPGAVLRTLLANGGPANEKPVAQSLQSILDDHTGALLRPDIPADLDDDSNDEDSTPVPPAREVLDAALVALPDADRLAVAAELEVVMAEQSPLIRRSEQLMLSVRRAQLQELLEQRGIRFDT